ncbi:CHAD domain-containing protein [Nakamurella leprariae]|uniref:CHAD domain-containing protein n=1 Tax=Nakamurella leprariae TaxID=2803911 RepID=A0A938YEW3_9ACTN|nr:CHAD domain-containing protein [Nakamurella leprariae]MBM9468276.1 CHAD domain-containing protein [Nakamurella leprariae]
MTAPRPTRRRATGATGASDRTTDAPTMVTGPAESGTAQSGATQAGATQAGTAATRPAKTRRARSAAEATGPEHPTSPAGRKPVRKSPARSRTGAAAAAEGRGTSTTPDGPVVDTDAASRPTRRRTAATAVDGAPRTPRRRATTAARATSAASDSTPTRTPRRRAAPIPAASRAAAPAADPVVPDPDADVAETTDDTLMPPRPAPRRPGLIPTDIADALGAVLIKATGDIRKHEQGSRTGGDIEDVHKMRVATRRIRAYLKAARPVLERESADRLRADLSALAGTLGVLRDLDVMIDRMHREAVVLGDPDTAALERLIGVLDDERRTARKDLVTELDQPAYQDLLAELDQAGQSPAVSDPWADLTELASAEWRRLRKARTHLHRTHGEHPPDDDLHELRIYGKRARYASELLPTQPEIQDFLRALADFQEVLGDHQDASVLEARLRQLVEQTGDAGAAIAAGRVVQQCIETRRRARAAYPDAWQQVKAAAAVAFG